MKVMPAAAAAAIAFTPLLAAPMASAGPCAVIASMTCVGCLQAVMNTHQGSTAACYAEAGIGPMPAAAAPPAAPPPPQQIAQAAPPVVMPQHQDPYEGQYPASDVPAQGVIPVVGPVDPPQNIPPVVVDPPAQQPATQSDKPGTSWSPCDWAPGINCAPAPPPQPNFAPPAAG
jgi:hypothetical protein